MSHSHRLSACACCSMNRRNFIAGCASCAGAMAIPTAGLFAAGDDAKKKKRVRVIYALHADVQPGPDWPNVGFNFTPVMKRMTAALSAGCPQIEFIPTTANGKEQAKAILEKDKSAAIDGYIVMQMNCWNPVVPSAVASGKPVLYADFLYAGSGGFLRYSSQYLRRDSKNFGYIGSSQFEHVVEAAKCFLTTEKPEQFAAAVAKVRLSQTPAPRRPGLQARPD